MVDFYNLLWSTSLKNLALLLLSNQKILAQFEMYVRRSTLYEKVAFY